MEHKGGACVKPVLLFLAAVLLPAFFITCVISPTAGGSTDTETGGVIAGTIIDSSGSAASNVRVSLIPALYNPREDEPLSDSNTIVTESDGTYRFTVSEDGTYNIYAERTINRTLLLIPGVVVDSGDTVLNTGRLANTGYLTVLLPDTVDTNLGYVFFEGTQIVKDLKGNISFFSGYYGVTFDAVPAAILPPLIFALREQADDAVVITPSLTVEELDTLAFGTINNTLKPLWRFSLLVAVKDEVSQHYGGIDQVKPLVEKQLSDATRKFNSADALNGILHFAVDSIHVYSGSIMNEGQKPLNGFHYRLLYDVEFYRPNRDNIIRFSFIYVWESDPADLFKEYMTDIITKLLGEVRGPLDLSWLSVDASDNQVNQTQYTPVASIMNIPSNSDTCDDYSISVINHNTTVIGRERDILETAFPDIMGVVVKSQTGEVLPGADIAVYGSELNSESIEANAIITGSADNNGRFIFSTNPFKDTSGDIVYGTLLLAAMSGNETAYQWFPMNEVGNAYFANPDTTLLREIQFE